MIGSWKSYKVGDIFKISSGGTPSRNKPEYFENGKIPWVKTGDLKGVFVKFPDEKITDIALANSSAKVFPKNTVLLAMYGATIGACSILPFEASTNQACAAFLPNEKCNVYFLYYFLSSIKQDLIALGVGGGQPNISAGIIKDLQIPLPPLPQQQKIANILDAADALRQNDKALIAKYDELTQSLFLDMFGDPVSNPKGLEKVKFLDLFNIETGKLDSNHSVINGKYPFFTCAKEVLAINSFSYDKEALLLAGNNAAGVYDVKHYIGKFDAYQRTYILTLDPTLRSYLFYKLHLELKLKDLQKLSIGSSTKYLTMKIFERIEFLSPPLELQYQFAECVAAIEAQKAIAQASLAKSEELFNSLLQKAFKGELV